jgi:hypothetical protein
LTLICRVVIWRRIAIRCGNEPDSSTMGDAATILGSSVFCFVMVSSGVGGVAQTW